ncbi:hypothetical protein B0T16DRAFT_324274 [Cercophora newfieldiana]|uniref:Amine oxidase domain-containing protein n=1 Tax=Cercophora newfieldiana TaxID=92897 RepID=A0AA39Y934_9PEZI|nr:hypothetical protein B0T16DRAFT_324274 [Cercophora newfieldiana]
MMFKFLGIDFDIVEANSERVGGRCATHSFAGIGNDCKHDYYDMGAMRIPNIPSMASTLNLIRNQNLLNIHNSLVPYIYRVYTKDSHDKETYYEPFCYWYQNMHSPEYVSPRSAYIMLSADTFAPWQRAQVRIGHQ